MFRFSWLALAATAALVCLQALMIQGIPVGDNNSKSDELSMISTINLDEDLSPSTDEPRSEESMDETVKPTEDPYDHIQVIKMVVKKKAAKEIEDLEKEIVKDYHLDEKSEVVQLLPCIHDHHMMDMNATAAAAVENKKEIPIETENSDKKPPETFTSTEEHQSKSSSDHEQQQTAGLTDENITEIIEMISFPEVKDDDETTQTTEATKDGEMEPRMDVDENSEPKRRVGRAISNEGRGYYILAFAPVDSPKSYTKLDIIPIDRSTNIDADDEEHIDENKNDHDDTTVEGRQNIDNGHDEFDGLDEADEGRFISSKKFSRYIRKMMRQIRKGTRKIQRKTRFKSAGATRKADAEEQEGAPSKSWFSWDL